MKISSVHGANNTPIRPGSNHNSSHKKEVPAEGPKDKVQLSSPRTVATNPLFTNGAPYDEFTLTKKNITFATQQFGLDPELERLVRSDPRGLSLSVVYHSTDQGLVVDAYRAVAAAGDGTAYTLYQAKEPGFDPRGLYRSEIATPLGNGLFFGSMLASKEVVVPQAAPQQLKDQLVANDYRLGREATVGELDQNADYLRLFGLPEDTGLEFYSLEEKSFLDKFNVFAKLFAEDSQYRVLKVADTLGDVGAAMLLGVITPKLWEQGAAYGIASTISSISNIGSPLVGIFGESILGSVVDNAVNSDKPMENLKKVGLYTAGLSTATAACYFALHPTVLGGIAGSNPGAAFLGLYGVSTLTSGISGVMSGKANYAIHDQIINKGENSKPEYSKNFFQILGVEASIARGVYLGTYSATLAAVAAFPGASVALAGTGAALWAASNYMFPLYQEKPEMKVTIEGGAYVNDQGTYRFDSGWQVDLEGGKGKLVKEDDEHYSLTFDSGELRVKNNDSVTADHKRRLKDYLPGFMKPRFTGEKERWRLDDGGEQLTVSRYGKSDYEMQQVSQNEFVFRP